ncbi:glycosyl hydrolase 115 family protein [Sphingomonas sp. CJ20]
MHRFGIAGAAATALLWSGAAWACEGAVSICAKDSRGALALIRGGVPATLVLDAQADPAVRHAAEGFAQDLERVGGTRASLAGTVDGAHGPLVIIGVAGQSPIIDGLVRAGKLRVDDLTGHWEAFRQVVVDRPAPGIDRALVIVGADRRGAVFGTYDLSEKMGVSPWHWFADVPVVRRASVYVTAGSRTDAPKVHYRGFFLNDEDPALKGWAEKHFGGVNAAMYAHVFELGLRMKANYLWPAMWGKAFNVDDPRNMTLADEMGVVMGTSHHEPMMRAQKEWHLKQSPYAGGAWDYRKNAVNLRGFWRGGIERMMSKGGGRRYDSLVTVGMRGDGDEPMAEGTATALLQGIVAEQRRIIADVTGAPAEQTPQVWALYKEVQDYYDHGMTVPDDVTLLFSDDNWGQIRRLPRADAAPRAGGYGVYYHFDYVGGPRSYKWLNTNQIEKTWQQMDLAYRRGARALWVVNVGDLKPMEYPLDFFLKMAWNPEAMTPAALAAYPVEWARRNFGAAQAGAIGELVTTYAQYAARRKPELVDADSFALGPVGATLDGGEFGRIVAEWQALERRALAVGKTLRPEQRDAYFQLVEHPILAVSNLYQLYYAVAWNKRLAAAGDPRANGFADAAEARFAADKALTQRYHSINGGKWDGMMAQTHFGYVSWSDPKEDVMPAVTRVAGTAPATPAPVAGRAAAVPGVVAIEAPDFTRAQGGKGLAWTVIPHLGRTKGAVLALPQGAASTTPADGVQLEYAVTLDRAGPGAIDLFLAPTLDTAGRGGIRVGVSIDDGPVTMLSSTLEPTPGPEATRDQKAWAQAVRDNVHVLTAELGPLAQGRHRVKIWRIDDNLVLQKLVVRTVPLPASYLGPVPVR